MRRAFRLRSRATAQLVYYLISLLSIPFLNIFELFSVQSVTHALPGHTLYQVIAMRRLLFRLFAFLILALLLVYAPELFAAVAPPYI